MSLRRAATTTFVGREADLRALAGHFAQGERLVTLVGPGGIGKTRLARRALSSRGEERGFFCDLVDARGASDVCLATCRAVGLTPTSDDPVDQLGAALRARGPVLVVLDNAEHVTAAVAALLARVLEAAPESQWLVTSRVTLRLPDEVVHEVGPLTLPSSPEHLADSEAAALWVDRVARVRKGYALDDDDATEVAELLTRLDGIPLAIELAATRTRVLSTSELLRKLNDRFALLHTEGRTWDERHRALGYVIESSWDALSELEKDALGQLTVLVGTFDADAAEAVLRLAPGEPKALDVLQALRDKSMLAAAGATQLAMYETIRAFVEPHVTPAVRAEAEARHAVHFAKIARALLDLAPASRAARQALEESLDTARSQLVAVAERAFTTPELSNHAVFCLAALDVFHVARDASSRHVELVDALTEHVLTGARGSDPLAIARAAALRGGADRRSGRYAEAEALFDLSAERATECGHLAFAIESRVVASTIRSLRGDVERAARELEAIVATAPTMLTEARACLQLGMLRGAQGRLRDMRALLVRAVAGMDGAPRGEMAQAHLCLAEVHMDLGELAAATLEIAAADELQKRLGDRRLRSFVLNMQGWLELHEDNPDGAVRTYAAAVDELIWGAAEAWLGHLWGWLGFAYFVGARYAEASAPLERAVALSKAEEVLLIFRAALTVSRALAKATGVVAARAELEQLAPRTDRTRVAVALLDARLELAEGAPGTERASALLTGTPEHVHGSVVDLLRRWLARAVAEGTAQGRRLRASKSGAWFARGAGPTVSLGAQELPKRILLALVRAHRRGPGEGLSIDELFAVGWPGEKASAISVEERVRAVIKRLRRAGLEGLLEAHGGRFGLVGDVEIEDGE